MSFVKKRPGSRFYWYFWRDENGKQKAKSLETEIYEIAEVKKGEEDKKRHYGEAGLPFKAARWGTAKDDFLKGYKDGSETKKLYERTFVLFQKFKSFDRPSSIKYNNAKGFRDWLMALKSRFGRPLKPATVNIHLRNIHTFFNECKNMGYVTDNPFSQVSLLPDTKRVHKYLKKDEVRKIISEARKSWPHDKVLMLLFFLYTGVRLGELINLRWASIDMDRGLFYLHGSETWEPKDREENTIGLHPVLSEGLKNHKNSSEYVFPGMDEGRRCKYSMERLFNRLYKRAGVPHARGLHILRHTFATHSGLSLKALQKVLGHSDIKTTMRYAHVAPEELQAVTTMAY